MADSTELPVLEHDGNEENQSLSIKKTSKKRKRTRIQQTIFARLSSVVHPFNAEETTTCKYNATSQWHRNWMTIRILTVSLIFVIVLFAFISIDVNTALTSMEREKTVQSAVKISIKIADVLHALQVERGMTVLSISSSQLEQVIKKLELSRQNTTVAIQNIPEWPKVLSDIFQSKDDFIQLIDRHRKEIEYGGSNSTVKKEIEFYTSIIQTVLDGLFRTLKENYPRDYSFDLLGYYIFLVAKDSFGIERALGASFFSLGYFNDTNDLLWYAEKNYIGKSFLAKSLNLVPHLNTVYNSKLKKREDDVLGKIDIQRQYILKNERRTKDGSSGSDWFSLMSIYLDVLLEVQKDVGEHITYLLKRLVEEKEKEVLIAALILVAVMVLTPLMVIAVVRMTSTIQKYAAKLESTTKNLIEEQKRTDSVLSAMFPESVAETLKKGEKVDAEYFDSVTVCFIDIVNFTNICSLISPMEVTSMLNAIYSAFDDTIDTYDVYKVETIGDAYMVVSGLPIKNGVKHVDQICRMAFDLLHVTYNFELVEVPGEMLLIRVGIHTGPCVSGIVGNKMPRYCLFGDTINTASRMQTTGLPQKIHVSNGTKEKLVNFQDSYETEFRGYLEVKVKTVELSSIDDFWITLHPLKNTTM